MERILERGVMDLVPLVYAAEHLERADLAPLGGGVHEVRVYPKDLHTCGAVCFSGGCADVGTQSKIDGTGSRNHS
jgi:hypothetical protein